jgi:hypothetical protein
MRHIKMGKVLAFRCPFQKAIDQFPLTSRSTRSSTNKRRTRDTPHPTTDATMSAFAAPAMAAAPARAGAAPAARRSAARSSTQKSISLRSRAAAATRTTVAAAAKADFEPETDLELSDLTAISPIDGRYGGKVGAVQAESSGTHKLGRFHFQSDTGNVVFYKCWRRSDVVSLLPAAQATLAPTPMKRCPGFKPLVSNATLTALRPGADPARVLLRVRPSARARHCRNPLAAKARRHPANHRGGVPCKQVACS